MFLNKVLSSLKKYFRRFGLTCAIEIQMPLLLFAGYRKEVARRSYKGVVLAPHNGNKIIVIRIHITTVDCLALLMWCNNCVSCSLLMIPVYVFVSSLSSRCFIPVDLIVLPQEPQWDYVSSVMMKLKDKDTHIEPVPKLNPGSFDSF